MIYVRPNVIEVTYFQQDIRRLTLAAMTGNGLQGHHHVNVRHILGIYFYYEMIVSKSFEWFHDLKVQLLKINIFHNTLEKIH